AMRAARDRYKDAPDRNRIGVEAGTDGYAPALATLVKGADRTSQQGAGIAGATTPGQPLVPSTGFGGFGSSFGQTQNQAQNNSSSQGQDLIRHVRFLRRIPVDPMTGRADWGKRSVQDDPESTSWGGRTVFDVFSFSSGTALDGTRYSDW